MFVVLVMGYGLDDFKNDCSTFVPQLTIPNGYAVNECVSCDSSKSSFKNVSHIVHQESAAACNDEISLALSLYYLTDSLSAFSNFFLPLKKQAVSENGNLVGRNVARDDIAVSLSKEKCEVICNVGDEFVVHCLLCVGWWFCPLLGRRARPGGLMVVYFLKASGNDFAKEVVIA